MEFESLSRLVTTETFAIFLWGHRELLKECSAQRLLIPESGDTRYSLQGQFLSLKVFASSFDPNRLHPTSRRSPKVQFKLSSKCTRRHGDNACESIYIELLSESCLDPRRKIT